MLSDIRGFLLSSSKLTSSFSQRKGMKATVVLFFFLGMSSLLFCINPKDEGIYEDAYMVTNAILKVTNKKSSK